MPGGLGKLRSIFGGKKEADTFEEVLMELGRQEAVRGSVLVDLEGLLVADQLPVGEFDPEQIGSLISVFRRFLDSWSGKFRKGSAINEVVLKGDGNWVILRRISELTLAVFIDPYQSKKLDIEDYIRSIRRIFDRKYKGRASAS